jgi:hypothetical protein
MKPSKPIEDADPEVAELFKKAEKLDSDFQSQLIEFEKLIGVSHKEVSTHLQDPENFTPEEWAEIQKEEQQFFEEMEKLMGKEKVKEIKEEIVQSSKGKQAKSKSRASRRKWIDTK